ncbi:MAG: hypothetical protein EF813_01290 [Methanosarcinales archaeon]|nr:MAG: hypothetical protein EF813_01290 [Methanosarcinales archaeon]
MRRIGIAVRVLLVIVLAGLPAGVQAQGGGDGLVAEWHFDEGSGSVLADSSGNGNDGVIYGASTLGFAAVVAIIGLLVAYIRRE